MIGARLWLCLIVILILGFGNQAQAIEITNVQAEPKLFVPAQGETTAIKFRLSAPATVTVNLFDGRDLLIRSLESDGVLAASDHTLTWDGADRLGRPVPPEEYRYTLVAEGLDGSQVEHDLTDLTGGTDVTARDVQWDPEAKVIRYRLPKAARVNIRVGLQDNGPLLGTVLDWVVRDTGLQEESWDGWDASRVLDLTHHPKLQVSVDAFTLSDNVILVGPLPDKVQVIKDLAWGETHRQIKRTSKKRMHFHSQQPLETRGDYTISLTLPPDLPTAAKGLPIVSGIVPVRLDIAPEDRERALARRFETVFFVDGVFIFENEMGFLPMTWLGTARVSMRGCIF